MKNWALNAMTRGTHYTHCSGGTIWRKEAYVPSNWGIAGRMCNGHTAAHSCGEQRKHPISGGGKKETGNAVPLSFPKEWSHMIPRHCTSQPWHARATRRPTASAQFMSAA